jgi:hypothetical protein
MFTPMLLPLPHLYVSYLTDQSTASCLLLAVKQRAIQSERSLEASTHLIDDKVICTPIKTTVVDIPGC